MSTPEISDGRPTELAALHAFARRIAERTGRLVALTEHGFRLPLGSGAEACSVTVSLVADGAAHRFGDRRLAIEWEGALPDGSALAILAAGLDPVG